MKLLNLSCIAHFLYKQMHISVIQRIFHVISVSIRVLLISVKWLLDGDVRNDKFTRRLHKLLCDKQDRGCSR